MEKYIKKINDKVLEKNDEAYAKKAKKVYRIVGYTLLSVGRAGVCGVVYHIYSAFLKI